LLLADGGHALVETVWELYTLISRRLLRWSALSVLTGIALVLVGGTYILDLPFLRGFGIQAIAWGLIDAAIAHGGQWLADTRRGDRPASENDEREAGKLRRLLLVNVVLDVFYVTAGLILARALGAQDPGWKGHGWGIVAQGVFLFVFDLIHAQRVPYGLPQDLSAIYRGKVEHESFEFVPSPDQAGPKPPAALLVHGYLGTPAETRALGQALAGNGWKTRGPLLPGFGTDVNTLPVRGIEDWLAVLEDELAALQAGHETVLLVGYSMGGALALCLVARRLAAQEAGRTAPLPDGLVLLAPFTQAAPGLLESLWGAIRRLVPPLIRPLRWADLNQPHLRHSMRGLMPDVDLDDPAVRRRLRQLVVPIDIVSGLVECSCTARRECRPLPLPTLVIQGEHDKVARPGYTRRLVQGLGPGVRYLEIDAGHSLVYPSEPGWPKVKQTVLAFADEVLRTPA
jgi:carboxylesterase